MAKQSETREAATAATAAIADALVGYPQPAAEPELIGKVPAKKTNGPMPRENVARGLAHFDEIEAERDRLQRELNEARELMRLLELELQEIKNTRGAIEDRIKVCLNDRDQAVRLAGELSGVLNSIASICVRYHHAQQDQE